MPDINKQIEYWRNTADNDINTAEILINSKKLIEGLFFCHLSIEKIIKAHVAKTTNDFPPKSHDLFFLTKKAGLSLSEEQTQFMQILMTYQLEGRYPEYYPKVMEFEKAIDYLCKTKDLLSCLKKML